LLQVWPGGQQIAPQTVNPVLQTQEPFTQSSLTPQETHAFVPSMPQALRLLAPLTQVPPLQQKPLVQGCCALQVPTQTPPWQLNPAWAQLTQLPCWQVRQAPQLPPAAMQPPLMQQPPLGQGFCWLQGAWQRASLQISPGWQQC
jgi:hypothetical protein